MALFSQHSHVLGLETFTWGWHGGGGGDDAVLAANGLVLVLEENIERKSNSLIFILTWSLVMRQSSDQGYKVHVLCDLFFLIRFIHLGCQGNLFSLLASLLIGIVVV